MTFILASGTDPLGHVIDKNSAFTDLFGFDVQLSVVSVVVGALIVVALLLHSSRRIKTGPESQGHQRYVTSGRFAQVVEVLVDGNLNVAGEKRLAVGHEEEVIRFGGIVSPSTLQGNTVLSSQVADARIEYRGQGITDQIQSPGFLTKLFTKFSPN